MMQLFLPYSSPQLKIFIPFCTPLASPSRLPANILVIQAKEGRKREDVPRGDCLAGMLKRWLPNFFFGVVTTYCGLFV